MSPVNYDLIVCVVSLMAGFFMFCRLGALSRRSYAPLIPVMVVASGIVYWADLLLVSYAAIYHIPSWLDMSVEWSGTWGYTSGRILNGVCWLITLAMIDYYLPMIRQCRKRDK